jgi:hypothetical protein
MNHSAPLARWLRESIGAELTDDEFDRLARVDALIRVAAAHDRQEAATLLVRLKPRDCRPMNGRLRTNAMCHPRTRALRPYRPIHSGAEPQIGQAVRPGDVDPRPPGREE